MAEEIFALAAVDFHLRFGGDPLLHLEQLELARQKVGDQAETAQRVDLFQQLLRLGGRQLEIRRRQVRQPAGIVEAEASIKTSPASGLPSSAAFSR